MRTLPINKFLALWVAGTFFLTGLPPAGFAQNAFWLPQPGAMVALSPDFSPAVLKGMVINPHDPFKFDFIIHRGDISLTRAGKQEEYTRLIKYFLAALAVPDEQQWVNLSPYEKNRIIPDSFGLTEMGRDLLAEDFMLKQITASMIYPESTIGKKFWQNVYAQAQAKYGTTNVPVNTYNKVWIIPDKAIVYEKGDTVYILDNHLKVMLEQDYLALEKHNVIPAKAGIHNKNDINTIGSQIIRSIVLPALEKEVNQGRNFAPLRQVFNSMLLATWYKKALKESILGKLYADKDKVQGIDQDPRNNQAIYKQYLQAFKKGVFNMIKEDTDRYTKQTIPRKYFSGGMRNAEKEAMTVVDHAPASAITLGQDDLAMVAVRPSVLFDKTKSQMPKLTSDAAMKSKRLQRIQGFVAGMAVSGVLLSLGYAVVKHKPAVIIQPDAAPIRTIDFSFGSMAIQYFNDHQLFRFTFNEGRSIRDPDSVRAELADKLLTEQTNTFFYDPEKDTLLSTAIKAVLDPNSKVSLNRDGTVLVIYKKPPTAPPQRPAPSEPPLQRHRQGEQIADAAMTHKETPQKIKEIRLKWRGQDPDITFGDLLKAVRELIKVANIKVNQIGDRLIIYSLPAKSKESIQQTLFNEFLKDHPLNTIDDRLSKMRTEDSKFILSGFLIQPDVRSDGEKSQILLKARDMWLDWLNRTLVSLLEPFMGKPRISENEKNIIELFSYESSMHEVVKTLVNRFKVDPEVGPGGLKEGLLFIPPMTSHDGKVSVKLVYIDSHNRDISAILEDLDKSWAEWIERIIADEGLREDIKIAGGFKGEQESRARGNSDLQRGIVHDSHDLLVGSVTLSKAVEIAESTPGANLFSESSGEPLTYNGIHFMTPEGEVLKTYPGMKIGVLTLLPNGDKAMSTDSWDKWRTKLRVNGQEFENILRKYPGLGNYDPERSQKEWKDILALDQTVWVEAMRQNPVLVSYDVKDNLKPKLDLMTEMGKTDPKDIIKGFTTWARLNPKLLRLIFDVAKAHDIKRSVGFLKYRHEDVNNVVRSFYVQSVSYWIKEDERNLGLLEPVVQWSMNKNGPAVGQLHLIPGKPKQAWEDFLGMTKEQADDLSKKNPDLRGIDPGRLIREWKEILGLDKEYLAAAIKISPKLASLSVIDNLKPLMDLLNEMGKTKPDEIVSGFVSLGGKNVKLLKLIFDVAQKYKEAMDLSSLNSQYNFLLVRFKEIEGASAIVASKADQRNLNLMVPVVEWGMKKGPAVGRFPLFNIDTAMVTNTGVLRKQGFKEIWKGYFLGPGYMVKLNDQNNDNVEMVYSEIPNFDKTTFFSLEDSFPHRQFFEIAPGSGVYRFEVQAGPKAIAVYRNKKLEFIGEQSGPMQERYNRNPEIVGFEKNMLIFQEGPFRYYLNKGNIGFKALDTSKEWELPLLPGQQYPESPNQRLAEPLFYAMNVAINTRVGEYGEKESIRYRYKGEGYEVRRDLKIKYQYRVMNLRTKNAVIFTDLAPYDIARYGFYGRSSKEVIVDGPQKIIDVFFSDNALIAKSTSPGGIDMNSANLEMQIRRDGNGVPLPVGQQDLENIHINGLVPVILDIIPADSTPVLSELTTHSTIS